jgi:hypothetical protein
MGGTGVKNNLNDVDPWGSIMREQVIIFFKAGLLHLMDRQCVQRLLLI